MTLWRAALVCGLAAFFVACDDEDPKDQGVVGVPLGGQSGIPPAPVPTAAGKTAAQWVPELGVLPDPIERALVTSPCGLREGICTRSS